MEIITFGKEHIEAAAKIAWDNYTEERAHVSALPEDAELWPLEFFLEHGDGIVATEQGRMVGYLCWLKPWTGAFDTEDSLGTFSPLHANGTVTENRCTIYQRMVEEALRRLARENIKGIGVCLYAHDETAKAALFEYGFGMRCKDSIREIGEPKFKEIRNPDFAFEELALEDFPKIRELRCALNEHLKEPPCFLQSDAADYERWLERVEKGDRRTFAAKKDGRYIAYLDVSDEGETFVTVHPKMRNIKGAYCVPEYRGTGVIDDLLTYVLSVLKSEGYLYLGVDYESYNPTGNRYWKKHFSEYTNSVTRRIELWCKDYTD